MNEIVESTKRELSTLKPLFQKVLEENKKLEESIVAATKSVEEAWQSVHEEQVMWTYLRHLLSKDLIQRKEHGTKSNHGRGKESARRI